MIRSAICILILLACGCGGSGTGQQPLSGSVSLDNAPLEQGTIRFVPLGKGRTAGGKIRAGEFEIEAEGGLEPGSYKVVIESMAGTGKMLENPSNPGETAEELVQIIPPRYNRQSELTAEVTADGENSFEFTLQSK